MMGLRVIENPLLTKRVMFRQCRTKRGRIRRKWAKNPKNWREEPDFGKVYQTPFGIVCHPAVARKLRAEMQEWQQKQEARQVPYYGLASYYGF